MTDKQINNRTLYLDCISEIFDYCVERKDYTACEVLKIINKTFDKVLGYDR